MSPVLFERVLCNKSIVVEYINMIFVTCQILLTSQAIDDECHTIMVLSNLGDYSNHGAPC